MGTVRFRGSPRQVVDCSLSATPVQSRLYQRDHTLSSGFSPLSLCWLPGLADHSDEFFLGNIPVLSESGHVVYGQLMAGGLPSLNGIFLLGAEELRFADQEKVRLDGSDVWWHVIGRPGILVLDSSQAFGCPSAPNLCLSPLWILHTA